MDAAIDNLQNTEDSYDGVTSDEFTFSSLGLNPELCKVITGLGYETPTPVQRKSIPVLLSGRDLISQAQTGTGKTAAFALPLVNNMKLSVTKTQVLVLTPTRELAIQVAEAFQSYARGVKNFHVLPIYGGQAMGTQLRQLERGPQVVVGTPGRVMDHLRRKSLSLQNLSALVIDEADEMLSMGFLEDIEWIMEQSPAEKQTALFSATMPRAIKMIAQKHLKDPEEVLIEQVSSSAALITQSHLVVTGAYKLDALTRILEVSEVDGLLIFVRTKIATAEVAEKLEARGYSAGALNGDMSQDARERTVERFKNGKLDVLVATDVAARGLHIDRISHVVNYDAPFDIETYTHRIGRTGRAGRSGDAILFVSPREVGILRSIERSTKSKIPLFKMPTIDDIAARRIEKLVERVQSALEDHSLKPYESVIKTLEERTSAPVDAIAMALCGLLHEDTPLFIEERAPERRDYQRSDSRGESYRRNDRSDDRRDGGRSGGNRGYQRPGIRDRAAARQERAPRREPAPESRDTGAEKSYKAPRSAERSQARTSDSRFSTKREGPSPKGDRTRPERPKTGRSFSNKKNGRKDRPGKDSRPGSEARPSRAKKR